MPRRGRQSFVFGLRLQVFKRIKVFACQSCLATPTPKVGSVVLTIGTTQPESESVFLL